MFSANKSSSLQITSKNTTWLCKLVEEADIRTRIRPSHALMHQESDPRFSADLDVLNPNNLVVSVSPSGPTLRAARTYPRGRPVCICLYRGQSTARIAPMVKDQNAGEASRENVLSGISHPPLLECSVPVCLPGSGASPILNNQQQPRTDSPKRPNGPIRHPTDRFGTLRPIRPPRTTHIFRTALAPKGFKRSRSQLRRSSGRHCRYLQVLQRRQWGGAKFHCYCSLLAC